MSQTATPSTAVSAPMRSGDGAETDARRVSSAAVMWTILWRELVRFRRQPTRIAAAIGTPVMFWAFLGMGFSNHITNESQVTKGGYGLFLLPGMMTMVALFTAIFSSISVIEDRNEGWLQSVLVSPASRWSIAMGKVLGGAIIAFLQAAVLLLAPPVWGHWGGFAGVGLILLALAFTTLMMTGIGVALAWKSETTQGFHAIMNLVLMPMWALSGAIFPVENQTPILHYLMLINPLTWCSLAISAPLHGTSPWLPLSLAGACAVAALALATFVVASPDHRGR